MAQIVNAGLDSLNNDGDSLRANKILKIAVRFWFLVALIGLFMFAYYIAVFYGGAMLNGEIELWGEASLKGYVKGDFIGNVFFSSHIAMAFIISFGGVIQLIPQIRKWSLQLHRINGRLFLITAFLISVGGLYLIWIRESITTQWGSVAITGNAILMIYFGYRAWKAARSHDVATHQKWALRTFIMTSGVWFFRVGFMAWIIINQGPVGSTNNLDGPFDMFWAYGNYLIPLGVLELYFYMSEKSSNKGKLFMAGILIVLTLVMAIGIFGAYSFMWKPYLTGANDGFF